MRTGTRNSIGKGVVAVVAIVALLVFGSFAYWLSEDQPGTPDDFRRRVAEAGLSVAWLNSGPRGGSGVVDTACGSVDVTINDVDDQLWISWEDQNEPATLETIGALLSCARR
jgi:hypothetical protein